MKRASVNMICILFVSIFFLKAKAQDSGKINLQQAIESAVNNNLEAKQSNLLMQTAEVTWKQSKANLLPDLIGNIGHGVTQGRSIDPFTNTYSNQNITFANYNLSSSVTLFNGFLLQNSIRQNAYAYEATKMEWQQVKDNITLNVILAYLQILNNEDLLQQSSNQAQLSARQTERLEALNKEGAITPSLLYDLKGQLANDQLAIIDNQNALNASKLALAQLMNVPFDKNLQIERINIENLTTIYDATVDQIYATALEQLALIKAAQLRKLSAQKGVKTARGNYYPAFFLSGNLNTNYSSGATTQILESSVDIPGTDYVNINGNIYPVFTKQNNFVSQKINYGEQFKNNYSTALSIGVRIPIVNSLQARNNVKLAKISLKNAEYVEENTKIQLRQSIEQAYFNMTAAFRRYETLVEQVKSFSESFKAAETRFNEGVGTSVDYLVAKNNLDRANINLISARYDYILRTKILDYYQSRPLW